MAGDLHRHAHLSAICPACGRDNDLHTDIDDSGATPQPGDVAVCWRCKVPARFELTPLGRLQLRTLTEQELVECQAHPGFRDAVAAMANTPSPDHALAQASIRRRRRAGR